MLVRARLVIVTRHRPSSVSAVHLRPSPCGGPGGRETDTSEGARSWGWLLSSSAPPPARSPPRPGRRRRVVGVGACFVCLCFGHCLLRCAAVRSPFFSPGFFLLACYLLPSLPPPVLLFLTAITKNKLNCSLYSLHCSTPWVLMAPPLMGSSAAQVQPFLLVRLPCHLSRPVVVVWSASVVGFGRARLPSR